MIPYKTLEISSSDGLVNVPATYSGRYAVALEAQQGDVAFTTLTDGGATSGYADGGLMDGKMIFGRFDLFEVRLDTLQFIYLFDHGINQNIKANNGSRPSGGNATGRGASSA